MPNAFVWFIVILCQSQKITTLVPWEPSGHLEMSYYFLFEVYCSCKASESFYFLTSWITSSSSSTWSFPTFCGLCFTDDPHTNALQREEKEMMLGTFQHSSICFTNVLQRLLNLPSLTRHILKKNCTKFIPTGYK